MLNKEEIKNILLITIVLTFCISIFTNFQTMPLIFLTILSIILINVFAKKITSFYFESEIEIKIWKFKQWGYKPSHYFKKYFYAGILIPLISLIIFSPLKGFIWMGSLIYDIKPSIYRAAKRHGLYSFSEISEDHIAYIASAGILANLLFAFLGYLVGLPEFTKLSIWFAFFNIIPISNLDGNKIFCGSKILWSFLTTIILILMGYTFLVI